MPHLLRAAIVVVAMLVVLGFHRAEAQPAPPSLMTLSIIEVDPQLFTEFGVVQGEAAAAQKAGGQAWRETWQTAMFGNPFRVGVVTPVMDIAQFDGPTASIKGAGPAAATLINERARRMITRQQIHLLQARPDLGFGTRAPSGKLAVLATISVAPGRIPDFERVIKGEVVPALKKAGVTYYGVARTIFGGDTNQFFTLLLFDNFADLGKGHPLERALGAEGMASLEQKLTGIATQVEREVIRLNDALSYGLASPPPPK
ncbi:MAG: hypothetical protein ABR606_03250 [Vicinamibacterales bacterium]